VACRPDTVADVMGIFSDEGFGRAAVVGEIVAGDPGVRVG